MEALLLADDFYEDAVGQFAVDEMDYAVFAAGRGALLALDAKDEAGGLDGARPMPRSMASLASWSASLLPPRRVWTISNRSN